MYDARNARKRDNEAKDDAERKCATFDPHIERMSVCGVVRVTHDRMSERMIALIATIRANV